jgi:DnaD/phage-associated family protein
MAQIHLKQPQHSIVGIPSWFIYDFMPQATSGYIKAYLYLFAQSQDGTSFSLEEIAAKLDMLCSELLMALNYWNDLGVLSFKEDQENYTLTFSIDKPESPKVIDEPLVTPLPKTFLHQTRPNYSLEELNIYKSQDASISRLFRMAEQYLGRLLSPSDLQVLFGLYDWLHMPIDLIEYLLEYCTEHQHTNMRYIEKTALAWVDQQITSVDIAKNKTQSDKRYYHILNQLGITTQTITPTQRELFNKWLNIYKLPMVLVVEGCKRTVLRGNPPNLNYLDTILTSWHKQKATTLEDIAQLDKRHAEKRYHQSQSRNTSAATKKNERFTTMYSHNWDFEELDKLEEAYLERKLNGGQ